MTNRVAGTQGLPGPRGRFILWGVALFLGSCAKVADPQPPLVIQPETTQSLQLVQVADEVQLVFPAPPADFQVVEVYRRCGEPLEMGGQPVAQVERQNLVRVAESDFFTIGAIPGPSPQQTCSYALKFVDAPGRRSEFSNIVQSALISPALPPTDPRAVVQEDRIIVRWTPPAGNIDGSSPPNVAGYMVNSEVFVVDPEYQDLDFQFNQAQTYRVQTVSRRDDPLVLSDFSRPATFVPRDEFPPQVPQELSGVYLDGKVQIFWDANEEADLRGYSIYKGTDRDSLAKLPDAVPASHFADADVSAGVTYYYQVTAVDQAGNESPRSEVISVRVE
ncbi:MAG: fibronectin type III domain-containing protein [Acidobacteriota bacterium]